jgi:hypothetical protein
MRSPLPADPSPPPPDPLPAIGEPRPWQGWHWLEAENRRVDAMDFGTFDFEFGLRELVAALAVILAVTMGLTAWLVSGG